MFELQKQVERQPRGGHSCWQRLAKSSRPEGRLNIKMPSYQFRDPDNKDKTVSRPSYLNHGNSHTWKDGFHIETGPRRLGQGNHPEGRLNIKISSNQYKDPHVKDKTVATWASPYLKRRSLYLEGVRARMSTDIQCCCMQLLIHTIISTPLRFRPCLSNCIILQKLWTTVSCLSQLGVKLMTLFYPGCPANHRIGPYCIVSLNSEIAFHIHWLHSIKS